jgi:LL-diaminopimelate aminotransferase
VALIVCGVWCLLQPEGRKEMMGLISFYMENAAMLRKTFMDLGFSVYGGTDAPYIWVGFPGQKSWDVFAEILEKTHIVTTPGSGFGPAGEGYVRVSAFGSRYGFTGWGVGLYG